MKLVAVLPRLPHLLNIPLLNSLLVLLTRTPLHRRV
jgi:hypothetical protein